MKTTDWTIFRKPSVVSVFLLVAFWNISVSSRLFTRAIEGRGTVRETMREIRDINLHLQLHFYQSLTHLRPIPFLPNSASLAYIDDDTHWTELYGNEPTDRKYLARLITNASQTKTKAAAIGVDVELLAPRHFPEGSDSVDRFGANKALLDAIHFAADQGVPVILAGVYSVDEKGDSFELPNIYTAQELLSPNDSDCAPSRCASFGYINLPEDKREIPLAKNLRSLNSSRSGSVDSFAFALAKAVRGPLVAPEAGIYGTFLPEEQYPEISVPNLANGDASAEKACTGRVILIGGHWHDLQGYGDAVDQHLSPAGYLSGLGLHANYLESVLQHQFTRGLPVWVDVVIDLHIGLIIYLCFELAKRWWWKLAVLLCALLLPILLAWLFLDLTNRYLDFLLPIELYFFHILYELIEKHFIIRPIHRVCP